MKLKKNVCSLALALILSLSLVSGCGQQQQPAPADDNPAPVETVAPAAHEGEWTFTDSLGRTVTFNGPITRVAPSGKLAQQCIYAVSPASMIGITNELSKGELKYFSEDVAQLPVFGTFYGKKANFNRESVLAANPQVVIDIGEQKKNIAADLDALQEQLGIPVIFIESSLTNMAPAFETLGDLLDAPAQGKALADYCAATVADVQEKAASIPEDERKTVYYGMMDTGLTTAAKGDLHAEVLDLVGAVNVVPAEVGHSFVDIDMERLLTWDPQVILFAPNSIYATAAENPVWKDLTAIQQGHFYEIPFGPYSWIDQPPAANRILGVKWLGALLYPEVFDYDMAAETVAFYDLFYHVELSTEDAHALLANSIDKAQ